MRKSGEQVYFIFFIFTHFLLDLHLKGGQSLTLKAPNRNCSRRRSKFLSTFIFRRK